MPWQTPPSFSYPYPFSTGDLNIIRNNLLYLYGQFYATSPSMIELEVKADGCEQEQDALIAWIDHKKNSLYYRIRVKPADSGMTCRLKVKYYDIAGNLKGTHTEDLSTPTSGTWYLMTNSDAAVDISGWSLTANTIYKILLTITALNAAEKNDDYQVELNFLYEQ